MPKPTNKKPFYSELRVSFLPTGTINSKIETLSELFTEWFLYDSTTANSLESFLENNGLSDIFSVADFTDLICGYAYLDEPTVALVSLLLPFTIPEQKIFILNNNAALGGGRMMSLNPEIIREMSREISEAKSQKRKERRRQYLDEYIQRPGVREQIKERKKKYYIANQEIIKNKSKKYRQENAEKIAAYKKQYSVLNRVAIAAYRAKYEREHADAISIRRKKYYQANRDYILSKCRQYAIEHAEEIRQYRHEHYIANKERINAKSRQYALEHAEQIAAYRKQYRESNHEELLAYEAQYRQENAEIVSARKKKCYQAKKEEYQARHKAYYEQHREEIAAQQRAKREKEKIRDESAKSVCPTFLYLLQMRHNHRAEFVKLLGQRNLVGFAIKKCPALQEMDASKCVFCDGTENPHEKCAMQQMAKMPSDILDAISNFVAIIKEKSKTR